jgi:FtsH-binding integral membrane protein
MEIPPDWDEEQDDDLQELRRRRRRRDRIVRLVALLLVISLLLALPFGYVFQSLTSHQAPEATWLVAEVVAAVVIVVAIRLSRSRR